MESPNTVSTLLRKRAEIAGRIEHHQTLLRQRIIDLDNLDATLRLFEPDIDLDDIKPKPFPPREQAFRGEVLRIVLAALRTADKPMTTAALARQVMAARGLNTADTRLAKTISKRVGSCLRHHRSKGVVRSVLGAERCLVWAIS